MEANNVIFKYPLELDLESPVHITMPVGAQILSVHRQGGAFYLWACVNPDNVSTLRTFVIRPTGLFAAAGFFDNLKYLDTVFSAGDGYVFHVFEVIVE